MITDIYLVCSDTTQSRKVRDSVSKSLAFHFFNPLDSKEKKKAFSLKSHWAAKLDPFAIVMDGDKPIKAFYSEACDVINDLIEYLNGEDTSTG